MKGFRMALCWLLAAATGARGAEEFFDQVEDALTTGAFDGRMRARLSGMLDLEGYDFQTPPPALIETSASQLFVPRLSLFLDAQFGAHAYFFAQSRIDRGFDPYDGDTKLRLDEYALRIAPWRHRSFVLQVGKFATVVGNWTPRHGSWANPFIGAPLLYENLTGIWDTEAVTNSTLLLRWAHVRPGLPADVTAREKDLRLPIVWGPSYATGIAAAGDVGRFRYAFELKHASLSSRPETWSHMRGHWQHPTVSGHVGYRPNEMWNIGVSASAGSYLQPAAPTGAGHGRGDYRQLVIAQDIAFAWHHVQVWTEVYGARFEIPGVGNADTLAYYAEAKYKFGPRLFGALRWNQQLYGAIPDRGVETRWGKNASRLDLGAGFRFSPHTQLKLQYNLQQGDTAPRKNGRLLAGQFTLRF
ncbi:MAG: hypothetical protein ABIZ49_10170 [Opitutaceae bacterium]